MEHLKAALMERRDPSSLPAKGRIPAIDWMRGLASLAVAYYHITLCWSSGPIRASGSLGWLGVEVFFVISGFVIPYSIAIAYPNYSLGAFTNYFSRRITRIELPATINILMCIALWHLSAMAPGFRGVAPHITITQFFANAFYIAPWVGESWLNAVFWTLAYEFVFYISVGSLFVYLFSKTRVYFWYAAVLVLLAAVSLGYLDRLVLLFVIGVSLCRYVLGLDRLVATIAVVGLCLVAVTFCFGIQLRYVEMSLAALITAVIIGQSHKLGTNWTGERAFAWLGTVSYSLYLVHVPLGGRFFNIAARFISNSPAQQLIVSLLSLAASVVFAAIFYKLVEQPAVMLAKKMKWKGAHYQKPASQPALGLAEPVQDMNRTASAPGTD